MIEGNKEQVLLWLSGLSTLIKTVNSRGRKLCWSLEARMNDTYFTFGNALANLDLQRPPDRKSQASQDVASPFLNRTIDRLT